MISETRAKLAAAKEKVAELETLLNAELYVELASLPSHYGFADAHTFANAVRAAFSGKRGRRRTEVSTTPKRRKRAVITDATRAQVKKLVEAGRSGTEIAQTLKISLPSVHNIKKALGLVKPRK